MLQQGLFQISISVWTLLQLICSLHNGLLQSESWSLKTSEQPLIQSCHRLFRSRGWCCHNFVHPLLADWHQLWNQKLQKCFIVLSGEISGRSAKRVVWSCLNVNHTALTRIGSWLCSQVSSLRFAQVLPCPSPCLTRALTWPELYKSLLRLGLRFPRHLFSR